MFSRPLPLFYYPGSFSKCPTSHLHAQWCLSEASYSQLGAILPPEVIWYCLNMLKITVMGEGMLQLEQMDGGRDTAKHPKHTGLGPHFSWSNKAVSNPSVHRVTREKPLTESRKADNLVSLPPLSQQNPLLSSSMVTPQTQNGESSISLAAVNF